FLETKDMLGDQLGAYRQGREPDSQALARICAVLQRLADEEIGATGSGKTGREKSCFRKIERLKIVREKKSQGASAGRRTGRTLRWLPGDIARRQRQGSRPADRGTRSPRPHRQPAPRWRPPRSGAGIVRKRGGHRGRDVLRGRARAVEDRGAGDATASH